GRFARRVRLRSQLRCYRGRPDCATPMESEQNIGTTRAQARHRSSLTHHEKALSRSGSARFMSNAENAIRSSTNYGCVKGSSADFADLHRFEFQKDAFPDPF